MSAGARTTLLSSALVALLASTQGGARAQAGAAPDAGSAVDLLASALAARVRAGRPETPAAVAVAAPSPALADAVATLLAARLSTSGVPALVVAGNEEVVSAARARGAATLVKLVVQLDGETLAAAGEMHSLWRNFWAGRTLVHSGPAAALAASVPADGAARLLATAGQGAAALVLHTKPFARFAERTAAIATGDLDGDGRMEVAVLLPSEVQLLDDAGRLLARYSLGELPPAPAPAREPFGTVCVRDGRVEVASARAAGPVALRREGSALLPSATATGPALGCGADALAAAFLPGVARLRIPSLPSTGPVWGGDAWRGHRLLLFPDGTATWTVPGEGRPRRVEDVGAGAALVEWNDGVWVAAGSAAANPAEDRLRLVGDRAPVDPVGVPGRILQVCRGTLDGRAALLLGVWTPEGGSEIRVVWRRP